MDISNITSASVPANNTQPQPPTPKSAVPPQEQQNSAVVKLSDQAQQMQRAESQNNTQQAQANTKEAAKAPGIQFMAGESKRGQVNTYA